jgi:hypothetical protein
MRVRQSEMAKGNDQERRGELDATMASKNKGSKDVPLFCVPKGVKSTPKLKL